MVTDEPGVENTLGRAPPPLTASAIWTCAGGHPAARSLPNFPRPSIYARHCFPLPLADHHLRSGERTTVKSAAKNASPPYPSAMYGSGRMPEMPAATKLRIVAPP